MPGQTLMTFGHMDHRRPARSSSVAERLPKPMNKGARAFTAFSWPKDKRGNTFEGQKER